MVTERDLLRSAALAALIATTAKAVPASNWLPAPNGEIYLVMRLYWPRTEAPSILPPGTGTWQPPGIRKL